MYKGLDGKIQQGKKLSQEKKDVLNGLKSAIIDTKNVDQGVLDSLGSSLAKIEDLKKENETKEVKIEALKLEV